MPIARVGVWIVELDRQVMRILLKVPAIRVVLTACSLFGHQCTSVH